VLLQPESIIAELLERLQTVHDMRWVFIPVIVSLCWRSSSTASGIATSTTFPLRQLRSSMHWALASRGTKDFIRSTQVDAELFAFAYPGRSVPEIRRALRVDDAFQKLLDASQS
jgi:hypothetical protein